MGKGSNVNNSGVMHCLLATRILCKNRYSHMAIEVPYFASYEGTVCKRCAARYEIMRQNQLRAAAKRAATLAATAPFYLPDDAHSD